jgi:hypothetical protein
MDRLWLFRHLLAKQANVVEVGHYDSEKDTVLLILRQPRNLLHYQKPQRWRKDLCKTFPNIRCRVGRTGLLVKLGIG